MCINTEKNEKLETKCSSCLRIMFVEINGSETKFLHSGKTSYCYDKSKCL